MVFYSVASGSQFQFLMISMATMDDKKEGCLACQLRERYTDFRLSISRNLLGGGGEGVNVIQGKEF